MSYTDDRDEIAELFGIEPKPRKGYSEEIPESPESPAAEKPAFDALPPRRETASASAPAASPTAPPKQAPPRQAPPKQEPPKQVAAAKPGQQAVPQQVAIPASEAKTKSTPASKPDAGPIEVKLPVKLTPPAHVEPHPLETRKAAPTPSAKPPEPVVEDEELLVYDELDLPDFSESDFISFDEKPEPPRKQTLPRKKAAQPANPAPEQRPQNEAPVPPAASPEPPSDTRPRATPRKAPAAKTPAEAPSKKAPLAPAQKAAAPKQAAPEPTPEAPVERKAQPGPKPTPAQTAVASATTASAAAVIQESPPASQPAAQPAAAPAGDEMLMQTHGLVKIYDGRTVVKGVDINVRKGEIVGLLGPNGAGKTTSFYMIVGLVPPNDGQVLFRGNDVTKMPMYKRARLGMGYLPQEESIFRKLTVEQNIMAVMETLKIPRKEKVERCHELLERFSITHIRKNVALTCSGGEKRRLTIARSLVTKPSLIMLDEPFSGVDPIAVNEIQSIVADLRESGLAILITDHNARQTLELVDRAYLIYEGSVLREGTRDFLINDPVSRELYLGDRFTM
ncbi:MAG: LPS export ABC transporter ATP-binding protein [Verrucomicrobiales bacterium]|nr:LPS export ABC transporter ATP-binding protein [Verrucomicrobiales bacterium]